jgi:hypothetical protein
MHYAVITDENFNDYDNHKFDNVRRNNQTAARLFLNLINLLNAYFAYVLQ